ncbi:hypothetical protein F8A10_13425 [Paracoccus kondratievae]|uniref:LamB/YcsF family protein n=1 Tax=Paracoccus kondratievae TaxID=135740 RepID=UPI0012667EC8|nr:LamB/YcsF family protein [Paracoccus kondratievae]QFQ88494.1 hypothetical protein F8A10_13425 [Paracoccus kondratievae]
MAWQPCRRRDLDAGNNGSDPEISFPVLPGSALEKAALARSGNVIRLFLADRGYLENGQLAPCSQPEAAIHDLAQVVARVMRVIRDGQVETVRGTVIPMPEQSILIHPDTSGAVGLARRLREGITTGGVTIAPLTRHIPGL